MGTISATTTPATPIPEPVSRNASTASATVLNVSPHRDPVCAANSLR